MTLKCSSENLWEPKAAPLDGALFSPAANFFYNFYNFFDSFTGFDRCNWALLTFLQPLGTQL